MRYDLAKVLERDDHGQAHLLGNHFASVSAAGDKYVNILGANVAKQCIDAGLLDEILVFFAPVLLGDGVRLFEHPGGAKVRLAPMSEEYAHWYRVTRK